METTVLTEQLQAQLEEELTEAAQLLARLEERLDDKPDMGLGTGNAGMNTWEMTLARRDRTKQQIDELQAALDRIEADEYGRCQNCGSQIDPERLEILPTSTLCTDCAGL